MSSLRDRRGYGENTRCLLIRFNLNSLNTCCLSDLFSNSSNLRIIKFDWIFYKCFWQIKHKKTPVISVRMLSKLKKEKSDKRIAFFKYSFLKSLWPFICNNFCINNFIQVSQHVHCPVMHSVLFNHVPCYHTRCTMSIHTTLHVYNQCWMSFI